MAQAAAQAAKQTSGRLFQCGRAADNLEVLGALDAVCSSPVVFYDDHDERVASAVFPGVQTRLRSCLVPTRVERITSEEGLRAFTPNCVYVPAGKRMPSEVVGALPPGITVAADRHVINAVLQRYTWGAHVLAVCGDFVAVQLVS